MPRKPVRLYDAFALLTIIIAIVVDQWTKLMVVQTIPLESQRPFPIFGHNLYFWYIQNSGAAFSTLSGGKGSILLAVLIAIAIIVVGYLYFRMWNTGSLLYKLVFGLILGGAFSNLIDRIQHSGYVVDFISFRIPEWNFYFAIFNVADACISVGVVLLFILVLFGGMKNGEQKEELESTVRDQSAQDSSTLGSVRSTEQDA